MATAYGRSTAGVLNSERLRFVTRLVRSTTRINSRVTPAVTDGREDEALALRCDLEADLRS